MVERMLRWRLLGDGIAAAIVGIDHDAGAVARARQTFAPRRALLADLGVTVEFAVQSLAEAAETRPAAFDLVLAHHTLDLLALDGALPQLQRLAAPGALFWFTLTFDGQTRWTPCLDRRLDAEVERRYHASMDHGHGAQRSRSGRRLERAIVAAGGRVAVAGPSWWTIVPCPDGYRPGERTVLEAMLAFHRASLARTLPNERLRWWLEERERQLTAGTLGLVVRHRDLAGWLHPVKTVTHPSSERRARSSSS